MGILLEADRGGGGGGGASSLPEGLEGMEGAIRMDEEGGGGGGAIGRDGGGTVGR